MDIIIPCSRLALTAEGYDDFICESLFKCGKIKLSKTFIDARIRICVFRVSRLAPVTELSGRLPIVRNLLTSIHFSSIFRSAWAPSSVHTLHHAHTHFQMSFNNVVNIASGMIFSVYASRGYWTFWHWRILSPFISSLYVWHMKVVKGDDSNLKVDTQ